MNQNQDKVLVGNFVTWLAIATGLGIGLGGLLGTLWDVILERSEGVAWGAGIGFLFCILTLPYDHFRQSQD